MPTTTMTGSATENAAPAPTPLDEFLALHRGAGLLAEYPKATALLPQLAPAELERAGRLLARLDPAAVAAAHPAVPVVRVAVTGHGTLSDLLPPLTAQFARHGLLLAPTVGDFDSYVFDLSDPDSDLYRAGAELTLCVLDPGIVLDELGRTWTAQDAAQVFAGKVQLLQGLVERFEAVGKGTLVLNTLPLPHALLARLVDYRSRAELGAAWREANAALLRLSLEHPALVVLDLESLTAEGLALEDPRLSVYAKAPLSAQLLARYAREIGHLARAVTGRTKKCLVLDLDNTVWGGVLGDDGIEGIEVADGYRGEAFAAFQRTAVQLGAQGVLLAVVSKNDLEPVRAALSGHPRMTLREDDLVRVTANWRPKPDNIRELAQTLNVGTDSMVFVDDSPFERGLVRQQLPEVAVVAVDADPAGHVEALLRDGWFNVRELTATDRARGAKYREEAVRKDFLDTFDSVEAYLEQLGVQVRLLRAQELDAPRLSQITLRTNQFNLTTERLQTAEVLERIAAADREVLTIGCADRFGDDGLVGAVFTRREGDGVHIENFLLSCRVFARGVEQACLAAILRHARDTGASAVTGAYRPTAKNGKVADLYPRSGFAPVSPDAADAPDGGALFRHDLAEVPAPPAHVHLIDNLGGDPA